MKNRTVSHLLFGHMVDMGDLQVRQPLPTNLVESIDPFLLLHHADIKVPLDLEPDHAGVGPHPHRGFSPVTFIFKGGVHHRDSRGNDNVIYAGGAQWMNAGMGIVHSERPPLDIQEIGGRQEIIQLWINTPAKHKMDTPAYIPVKPEEAATHLSDDGKISISVFSGNILGLNGSVKSQTEINAATIQSKKGGKVLIELPKEHNAFIYLLDGKITVEGFGLVEGLNLVLFKNDGDQIEFEALADTRILLMSGQPLNEKVVAQGPFVMNSSTEILQAMRDYQVGKMGTLIED